jgi:DNA-binding transcriptional ArsR family regulator
VRLAILRAVVKGPAEGTPAGDLQARLDIPASTLSHHLATLSQAGLVGAERQGTFLRYRADFKALRALTEFIWEDCCRGGCC